MGPASTANLSGGRSRVPMRWQAGDRGRHLGQRGGRGHPGAPRAASVCAADRAGAESGVRRGVNGSGLGQGPKARATSRGRRCAAITTRARFGARWGDVSVVRTRARSAREGSWLRDRPSLAYPPRVDIEVRTGKAFV